MVILATSLTAKTSQVQELSSKKVIWNLISLFVYSTFLSKPCLSFQSPAKTSLLSQLHVAPKSHSPSDSSLPQTRRSILEKSVSTIPFLTFFPLSTYAATSESSTTVTSSSTKESEFPAITHKAFFDIRISRSDGSFYIRDDLPDTPENKVFTYTLTFGLFGNHAPVHVEEFLKYITVPYDPLDESPLPSYSRSIFTRLNQSNGLLQGGNIPGLEPTTIGGGTALKYMGRILPSKLWIERSNNPSSFSPISHQSGKGLLTHRTLDLTPEFGITTRPNADLDSSHVVFGRLLLEGDEYQSNREFLSGVQDLPTYSIDRPSGAAIVPPKDNIDSGRAAEALATSVFNKQREIFRGAAKSFGDTRLDKIYEGKLLRKVMVTKVGLL